VQQAEDPGGGGGGQLSSSSSPSRPCGERSAAGPAPRCHVADVGATRVALEWAPVTLLLANGAALCLAAAAVRLRLGPPCILNTRVHRLPLSASAPAVKGRSALRLLLCDGGGAAASRSK